jgi:hypothetical protein
MKLGLVALTLAFTASAAFAETPKLTPERNLQVAKALFATKRAAGIGALAMKNENIAPEVAAQARPAITSIDCANNPSTFGTPNPHYCAIRGAVFFGWHADPALVVRVTGYAQKAKLAAGQLTEDDFIVTNVLSQTPLPTGLESLGE